METIKHYLENSEYYKTVEIENTKDLIYALQRVIPPHITNRLKEEHEELLCNAVTKIKNGEQVSNVISNDIIDKLEYGRTGNNYEVKFKTDKKAVIEQITKEDEELIDFTISYFSPSIYKIINNTDTELIKYILSVYLEIVKQYYKNSLPLAEYITHYAVEYILLDIYTLQDAVYKELRIISKFKRSID